MDELIERLKLQSEYPKLGLHSHKVCVITQEDLKEVIKIIEKINPKN